MIEERYIFHLTFGDAKEGIALLKEAMEVVKKDCGLSQRLLSDISGESYTMIVEIIHENENNINLNTTYWKLSPNLEPIHEKFQKICRSIERELYSVRIKN